MYILYFFVGGGGQTEKFVIHFAFDIDAITLAYTQTDTHTHIHSVNSSILYPHKVTK